MTDKNHTQENPFEYEGFSSPKTTQVPDDVFDVLMPQLKDAELRVLLYIIRRTYGFKKDFDNISLKQMVDGITTRDGRVLDRGTGLPKSAVARALVGLREKRIIVSRRNSSAEKGNMATTYRLRFKDEADMIDDTLADPRENNNPAPLSLYGDRGVSRQEDKPLSLYEDTQETVVQHTDNNLSNIRKRSHADFSVDNSVTHAAKRTRNGSVEQRNIAPQTNPSTFVEKDDTGRVVKQWGMEALGEILKKGRGRPSKQEGEERQMILAFIGDFAREFSDKAELRSSVSRAYNIYKESQMSPLIFQDRLYQARLKTKENRARIRTSPMAYFFACLETEAGLRPDDRETSGVEHQVVN